MIRPVSIFSKIFLAPFVSLLFVKNVNGKMPSGNFILAPNHQSYLDIVACGYLCVPRRFTFIGQVDKGKGFWGFMRSFFYFLGGVIPLNRKDDNSKKKAFDTAVEYLKSGYSLVIYPEGTRSKTGEVQEGKWGVAKLYLETGVPILPLGIKRAIEVLPPSGKINIKRIVELNVGKPLRFEEEFEKARPLPKDSEEYRNICIVITGKVMEEIKKLVYEKN